MQKSIVTIENWAVVQKAVSLNYEELQPGKHLIGKVVGHAFFSSTDLVYTSPILSVDVHKGRVETRNTVYQLGRPSDAYMSWESEHNLNAA